MKLLGDGVLRAASRPDHRRPRRPRPDARDRDRGVCRPRHAGVAAGRVVSRDGDIFGRTVEPRVAHRRPSAEAGQLLVEEGVVARRSATTPSKAIAAASIALNGIADPVEVCGRDGGVLTTGGRVLGTLPSRSMPDPRDHRRAPPRRCSTTTSTAACARRRSSTSPPSTATPTCPTTDVDELARLVPPRRRPQEPRALPRDLRPHVRGHAGPRRDRPGRAECAEDLAADGVVYAEVRMAPELCTEQGLTLDEVGRGDARGLPHRAARAAAAGHPIVMRCS